MMVSNLFFVNQTCTNRPYPVKRFQRFGRKAADWLQIIDRSSWGRVFSSVTGNV